ncbi:cell division protein FtsL [Schnuerera sp.]|uniref:cell division protein FtsL n=1 Tax=Schnuerera sp. TaxID=2794844 RepID=UPI002C667062|nr:cell division protein FtsL [Schnuerera sp.]HSH35007.1 cell division protein FtsL [Schnuerera sp.]
MLVAKKDLNYYYPEKNDIETTKTRRVVKKKKKSRALYRLIVMGIAMVGLILALFILYRYANITKIRLEITELEKQKIELEKEKENLVGELEAIKSSSKIEEDAIIKLGMDYPTEDQVVYVDIDELVFADELEGMKEFFIVKQFKNIVNLVLSLF